MGSRQKDLCAAGTEKGETMKRLCDLHSHTTASDGSYTPAELVNYAKKKNLAALAITDHDTVAGLPEAVRCAGEAGQKLIPGVEMTTKLEEREIHLVGLFVDWQDPSFQSKLQAMAETRVQRNEDMVRKLAENGFEISMKDLDRFPSRVLTKAHIAAILLERGYGTDIRSIVQKYLLKGCVGYVARKTPDPAFCLHTIHEAGGIAIVAHTNQIDRKDRDHSVRLCRQVLDLGADGLETRYSEFDEDWERRTEAIAAEYGCLRSGGSDFHGTYKNLDLMTGAGNLAVPYEFVERMERFLAERDSHAG